MPPVLSSLRTQLWDSTEHVAQIFYARVSKGTRAPFAHIATDIFNLRNGIFCLPPPLVSDPTTIGTDNCELRLFLKQTEGRTLVCKTNKWKRFTACENNEQQSCPAKETSLELVEDVFESQIRSVCLLAYILSREVI